MSGECDKCGEHCLDCKCKDWVYKGLDPETIEGDYKEAYYHFDKHHREINKNDFTNFY